MELDEAREIANTLCVGMIKTTREILEPLKLSGNTRDVVVLLAIGNLYSAFSMASGIDPETFREMLAALLKDYSIQWNQE